MPEEPEVELVFHESLTSLATPAFCRTVLQALATPPAHLRLDLEDVKVADVTGPAALLQAVRLCDRSEVHTSELQSPCNLVCRLLLEKKKKTNKDRDQHACNVS